MLEDLLLGDLTLDKIILIYIASDPWHQRNIKKGSYP